MQTGHEQAVHALTGILTITTFGPCDDIQVSDERRETHPHTLKTFALLGAVATLLSKHIAGRQTVRSHITHTENPFHGTLQTWQALDPDTPVQKRSTEAEAGRLLSS